MVENFMFSYKNKTEKIEDCIFDYDELEDKFISTFGLEKELKSKLKFFLNGKEIMKDDELMDIIKPENIIEVQNINDADKNEEEPKVEEKETKEETTKIEEDIKADKINEVDENNKNELSKNIDSILSEKFEENNQKIENIITEKTDEKILNLKTELLDIIEKRINSVFSENEINQKIIEIDNKINKLNQEYIDYKSIKIKYFNKFIEFLNNKSISVPQDSICNETTIDSSKKNEDIDNLKEQNNKLKNIIKKLKKEKDDMKDKLEKEIANKEKLPDISPQLENFKKDNETLKEEKENLINKIKILENELKKKSEKIETKTSSSLSSSKNIQKKYKGKLVPNKKDIVYLYDEVAESEIIELNLTIKNEGEDELPKNCEVQLMNDIEGLTLEKCKTKSIIKESDEINIKFKVDINLIKLNEDISVKFKLLDDNKKDIDGAKCKLNIIIKKEEKPIEVEELSKNNNFLEENDYNELYNYINEILSIETLGENISSFKNKISEILENKKEKYENITEKTEFIDNLKEDLEVVFN